ncbi:MAG: hypothetical protein SCH71_12120 [Desulfobulbaceae bacterium]|nr:hypothetical protein [Desulfobulbaceae bacterium]
MSLPGGIVSREDAFVQLYDERAPLLSRGLWRISAGMYKLPGNQECCTDDDLELRAAGKGGHITLEFREKGGSAGLNVP